VDWTCSCNEGNKKYIQNCGGKMDRLILKWVIEKEVMRIELAPDDVPGRSWCYLLLSEN
jgi:hypothetical protein